MTNQAVTCAAQTATVRTPTGFARLQAQLRKKAWGVSVKQPFAGPEHVLDYVGRSTHRVAIANHRSVDGRDGHVRFPYRERRQGDVSRTRALEACECIRRFLVHGLPHGFVRIRPSGFWATRCKARALGQCRPRLGQPPETPAPCAQSVAAWMQQWTGMDSTRCPHCGAGPLLRRPLPPPGQRDGAPLPPPIFDSSEVTRRSGFHTSLPGEDVVKSQRGSVGPDDLAGAARPFESPHEAQLGPPARRLQGTPSVSGHLLAALSDL